MEISYGLCLYIMQFIQRFNRSSIIIQSTDYSMELLLSLKLIFALILVTTMKRVAQNDISFL